MKAHVLQKHARGCGPAVLAMVCDQEYDDVVRSFGDHDFNDRGIYWGDMARYLAAHGFAFQVKAHFEGWAERVERDPWPVKPFAPIHIVQVDVTESSTVHHWVVMADDGTISDPLTSEVRTLDAYYAVNHIAGLYYVEGQPGLKKPTADGRKPDGRESYERLIGPLRARARELGYAIGAHGSLIRDIDLIACPWTNAAVDPITLAAELRKTAAKHGPHRLAFLTPHENTAYQWAGKPGCKPHGRLCWTFHLGNGSYIDLSVMPKGDNLDADGIVAAREAMEGSTLFAGNDEQAAP